MTSDRRGVGCRPSIESISGLRATSHEVAAPPPCGGFRYAAQAAGRPPDGEGVAPRCVRVAWPRAAVRGDRVRTVDGQQDTISPGIPWNRSLE